MTRVLAFFFFTIFMQTSFAQPVVTKINEYFSKVIVDVQPNSDYELELGGAFTSATLKITSDQLFEGSYLFVADTLQLVHDSHNDTETKHGSQLIIFATPVQKLTFHSQQLLGNVEIQLFNSTTQNTTI